MVQFQQEMGAEINTTSETQGLLAPAGMPKGARDVYKRSFSYDL